MAQYINKDALVAEFERRISQLESKYKELSKLEIWITAKEIEHKINGLKEALSIVNALEAKEMDLEKEIDDYMAKEWEGIEEDKPFYGMIKNDLSDIAKHFFELGIKVAQKEEEN